jgi:hypothetical protein
VLAGREPEVPPVLGAREGAICAAADAPVEKVEKFGLGKKLQRGVAMFMFRLRFAWDLLKNTVVETRTICLPKRVVAQLRS